jgi:outer membrane protein
MIKTKAKGLVVLFFLILINNSHLNAEEKIMFVDAEFVYVNSVAGKNVNKEIQSRTKNLSNKFKEHQEKLKAQEKNLNNQKNVLSEDEFKKRISKLKEEVKVSNKDIAEKNKELLTFKNNIKNEFSNELRNILQEYAKKNSVQMIINKKNILIGKKEFDASNDILILFDKNIKKFKTK